MRVMDVGLEDNSESYDPELSSAAIDLASTLRRWGIDRSEYGQLNTLKCCGYVSVEEARSQRVAHVIALAMQVAVGDRLRHIGIADIGIDETKPPEPPHLHVMAFRYEGDWEDLALPAFTPDDAGD